MIAMRVTDDDVFDIRRIQSELGEPVNDFRLCGPRKVGVDDDETRICAQCPGRVLAGAEPIEVVEYFVRRRVPACAIRCGWSSSTSTSSAAPRGCFTAPRGGGASPPPP